MEIPNGWGKDHLSDFLQRANENEYCSFVNFSVEFGWLRDINVLFEKVNKNLDNPQSVLPALLLLRTHAAYLGACRISLSGQIPEAYMLFRGCLENALYAFFMYKKPELTDVWMKRNNDEKTLAECKNKFQIREILNTLKKENPETGTANDILYKRAIDQGAHPNLFSVFGNLGTSIEESSGNLTVRYLTGANNLVALKACVKTNAQVGIAALLTLKEVFRARFDLLGVSDELIAWRKKV